MALKDLVVRGPKPKEVPIKSGRGRPSKPRTRHSREPMLVNNEVWYYEMPKGLLVVHEIRTDDGKYVRTDQFLIPWRSIMASVYRHEPYDPIGARQYKR